MPTFRGRPACSCLVAWLPVFEAELKRLKVIKSSIDIAQLIGGAPQSGGTHSKGGAFDIWQHDSKTIQIAREMGAATWARTRKQGFDPHAHGVLNGCPHNAPARYQIAALKAGYNGLGAGGRGGRDDGSGPRSLRSYKAGIKWAKARQKASAPKPMRTTEFTALLQNMASDKGTWVGTRSGLIARRIKAFGPHFVSAVELYDDRRTSLSSKITLTYKTVLHYYGKVQYVRRSMWGWQKIKAKTYALGNGKHAIAVHYRHRKTGANIVLVSVHLSWEHDASKDRKDEIGRLVAYLKRDFAGLPWLVTGDFNDAHRATSSRPNDTAGDALRAAGLHDLYFDVPNALKKNRDYNTANGFKSPPTRDQIHLDRFFGTKELVGKAWTADVQPKPYPSDHWAVFMRLTVKHPKK